MKINELHPSPIILEAMYREADLPEHAGNPLINALPPFQRAIDMSNSFGRFPHICDIERKLPGPVRMQAVSRLNNYLEPLPAQLDVIEKIGLIVREGYTHRNPNNEEYRKALIKFYRRSMNGEICPIETSIPSTAPSFALFGVSGVGKSTVVERTLCYLPHVMVHKSHHFSQVVWVKIDCPPDGSLKQFALAFLDEMDSLLGEDYTREFGGGSADQLILAMAKVASFHHLGVLVIDEIQNLLDANGVGQEKMINFLVSLCNVVKIPLVFIGTPRALKLLGKNFREARRIGDHGVKIWDALDYGEDWRFFIDQLFKYQWTNRFTDCDENLRKVLYEQTQGIHALVVRLFQLAQLDAIRRGTECLTSDLFEKVAKENFKLIALMLVALSKGTFEEIDKYEDLLKKTINQSSKKVEAEGNLAILKGKKQESSQESAERMRAISAILAMGYEESLVQNIIADFYNNQPHLTSSSAVKLFLESIDQGPPNDNVLIGPSLSEIVKTSRAAGLSALDGLKNAGFIDSPKRG